MERKVFIWEDVRYTVDYIISYELVVLEYSDSMPNYTGVSIKYSCAIDYDAVGKKKKVRNIKCDSLKDAQALMARIDACYDDVIYSWNQSSIK